MMISNGLSNFTHYSFVLGNAAHEMHTDSLKDNGTLGQDLSARGLCIAQTVVSIVSMPLLFLGMLFGSAFALCIEGKEAACNLLKKAVTMPIAHLSAITECLVGVLDLQPRADKLRNDSIKNNGTWGQDLTARALFIAQAVIAIVITPLLFLTIFFAAPLQDNKEKAYKMLITSLAVIPASLAFIPTNLIAACVPHSLEWNAPASQVRKCLGI